MSERVLYDCDYADWDFDWDTGSPESRARCNKPAVVRLGINLFPIDGVTPKPCDWCATHARQALESELDRALDWERAIAEQHAARSTA